MLADVEPFSKATLRFPESGVTSLVLPVAHLDSAHDQGFMFTKATLPARKYMLHVKRIPTPSSGSFRYRRYSPLPGLFSCSTTTEGKFANEILQGSSRREIP